MSDVTSFHFVDGTISCNIVFGSNEVVVYFEPFLIHRIVWRPSDAVRSAPTNCVGTFSLAQLAQRSYIAR